MADAIVVGAGPNGLAAAIVLARAGLSVRVVEAAETVGGGTRSAELTLPGFVHDVCSAIHPLGIASPFLRSLPLEAHGLEWVEPPASLAHAVDDGTAVLLERSPEAAVQTLGEDDARWRRIFAPLARDADSLLEEILAPPHVPAHPLPLARFGLRAMLPATISPPSALSAAASASAMRCDPPRASGHPDACAEAAKMRANEAVNGASSGRNECAASPATRARTRSP